MRNRLFGAARCALSFALTIGVADAQSFVADPGRAVVRAADINHDGAVSSPEWTAFRAGLGADANGVIDRRRVTARALAADGDRDGRLTEADVRRAVSAREVRATSSGYLSILLPALADADGDGKAGEQERERFLEGVRYDATGAVEEETVLEWMKRAGDLPESKDRNAMTPGVVLATFDAALDADANGKVTLQDLDALHAALDANVDGVVEKDELTVSRRSAVGLSPGRWAVSKDARRKPALMPWQRNLDDALALSQATGKPLLLCVNMDGENASESLAWRRYRDPRFVELVEGFIPVIASPDRREPREYDDRGRRLPDKRFGRVVNSEHIDVEPQLFKRYFNGRRVAPRHVGVSPSGDILFDVFLVQDLSVIDRKLREHGKPTPAGPDPMSMSADELLASPDAAHREVLEARYLEADDAVREELVKRSLSKERATQHPELLRLGLRDPNVRVRFVAAAWTALNAATAPVDLVREAMAIVAGEARMVEAAIAGLTEREATEENELTRKDVTLLRHAIAGLARPSAAIDPERWSLAVSTAMPLPEESLTEADIDPTITLLTALDAELSGSPDDVELQLQATSVRMRLARIYAAVGRNPSFFFEDVITTSEEILEKHPDEGRALGYRAWASFMLADMDAAASFAAQALPNLLRDAGTPLAANVLEVLANTRTRAIYLAMTRGDDWDPSLLADASAAYEVLLAHPSGTEAHANAYLQLLNAVQAHWGEARAIRLALARFPLSGELHKALRAQVLRDEGARALEDVYEGELLETVREEHGPTLAWFHGLATLVAAERDVENRDRESAWEAYQRSRERFQAALEAEPDFASASAHYQCLALAGAARIEFEAERYGDAADLLVEAVRTAPGSANSPDGLGKTPAETARDLRRTLVRRGEGDRARSLETRLGDLGLSVGAAREAGSAR